MLAVLVTDTGSNQRQTGGRAREQRRRGREGSEGRAINKVTAVFIHHASEEADEDLPVPLALLAFHWTVWHLHHRVS